MCYRASFTQGRRSAEGALVSVDATALLAIVDDETSFDRAPITVRVPRLADGMQALPIDGLVVECAAARPDSLQAYSILAIEAVGPDEAIDRLNTLARTHRPTAVFWGAPDVPIVNDGIDWPGFTMVRTATLDGLTHALQCESVYVAVCDDRHTSASRLLSETLVGQPWWRTSTIVIGCENFSRLQTLVDTGRLFYATRGPLPPEQLARLVNGAALHYVSMARRLSATLTARSAGPLNVSRVVTASGHLDTSVSIGHLCAHAATIARSLVDADHAACVPYEAATDSLLLEAGGTISTISAATGLSGFAARTASTLSTDTAHGDPRYDPEVDLGVRPDEGRVLAVAADTGGAVAGVLIVTRQSAEPPFSNRDAATLAVLAQQIAPLLDRSTRERALADTLRDMRIGAYQGHADSYRVEALEHLARTLDASDGDVLRIDPRWTCSLFPAVLLLLLLSLGFVAYTRVGEVVTAAAIVESDGRTVVTAVDAGTVTRIVVSSGAYVTEGAPLVYLDAANELAELSRVEDEFNTALLNSLLEVADVSASRQLAALEVQVRSARDRARRRAIKAPRSGLVRDVRVRPGHRLLPGGVVTSIDTSDPGYRVTALFPGSSRPQLEIGATLRFELSGYAGTATKFAIETVSDELLPPDEVVRTLGASFAPRLRSDDSRVLVTGRLLTTTFEHDGRSLPFFEGMLGTASLELGKQSLAVALLPWLKQFLE